MGSALFNSKNYFSDKEAVVAYVAANLRNLDEHFQSIITIKQEKSEVFSVDFVIYELSEDTQTQNSSSGLDVT